MLSRKYFPTASIALSLATTIWSGVIDNRSNFSAAYLRQLARNADTRQPDAAAYDPAGLAYIAPGLHVEIDNQTLTKHNINRTDKFEFASDLTTPFLPTAFAVWQKEKWAAFASGTLVGGGGNLHYDKGSVTVFPLVGALSTANPATAPDLQLSSLYWGATLGGSYAIKDWVSVSLAGRWIIASTQIRAEARGETLIDHEETANAPTLLFGVHLKPVTGLDIGLRYENIAKLEWEVQKSNLNLNKAMNAQAAAGYGAQLRGKLKSKGETFNHDLPPVAALGVGYTVNPYLRIDIAETFYWQTIANWEGTEDKVDDGLESAIGLEISPRPGYLSFSLGAMATMAGANSATYLAESPALDGYTLGGGTHWQASPKLAFNLSLAYSGTYDDHVDVAGLGPVDLEKDTWVYAVSIGIHLP